MTLRPVRYALTVTALVVLLTVVSFGLDAACQSVAIACATRGLP